MTAHNDASFDSVMAGLVPAIHVFAARKQDVDARAKRGHDGRDRRVLIGRFIAQVG
jgi:hypothetical protein